jgi:LmbE family N-acetylglucosaminyl deacetylase
MMTSDRLCLLAVYAHPDDEGLVTGMFARYRAEGVHAVLVCATRGEEGEIAPGVDATPDTLGTVREQELRSAMGHVGVDEIHFLGYRDSGMVDTAPNQRLDNLHNAPLAAVAGQLVRIIRQTRPQVVITFDPTGGYGHPDHIKIHHATMAAFERAGDPNAYPEQLNNGLLPYQPLKLYWNAFSPEFFARVARYFKEQGIDTSEFGAFDPEKRGTPAGHITTTIDVSPYLSIKERAWASHASQHNPKSIFGRVPPELMRAWQSQENLELAETRLPRVAGIEDDLFAGVR